MARDSRSGAAALTQALDMAEARLATLEPGLELDVVVEGLRDAAEALAAAVREVAAP